MRNGSEQLRILFRVPLVACALVLVVALVALGAGTLAIISVFTSLLIFIFVPFDLPTPAPVAARRFFRSSSPRAPPLD